MHIAAPLRTLNTITLQWVGTHPRLVVLSLGLFTRLSGIQTRPLWYDEAFAVLFSEKGLGAMLSGTLGPGGAAAADVHPLLYYSLLHGWMTVWGASPAAVRMLSILLGLGVVWAVFEIGQALFGRRVAVLAALLAALSPFQVHYSQEVRMYALLAFWLAWGTLALLKAVQGRCWRWWAAFSLACALAMYTHSLAAVYILPLALTPLLGGRWRALPALALSGIGALLLYAPWLVRLPAQLAKVQAGYWIEAPPPARLVTALLSYLTNLPLPGLALPAGLFFTLLCLFLGAWQTWRAWRARLPQAQRGLWLAYLAFAPLVLLYTISQWRPVFIERALLPAGAAFLLWMAWVLLESNLPRGVQAGLGLALLGGMALGLYQHAAYSGFPYAPYDILDRSLRHRLAPGDVILHSNKLTFLPAVYYDRDLPQRYLADPPGSGSDTLALATQQALGLLADPDPAAAAGSARRVWLVIFARAIDEYQQNSQPHPHLSWLEASFQPESVEVWGDVRVYGFAR